MGENLTYYMGIGYLGSAIIGAAKGAIEGVQAFESGDTMKLKANRILNACGLSGRIIGNGANVIGLLYVGMESGMVVVRDVDDVSNSVAAGLGTGHLIMEYLVKISKKACILELKRRYLKITVLTTNMPEMITSQLQGKLWLYDEVRGSNTGRTSPIQTPTGLDTCAFAYWKEGHWNKIGDLHWTAVKNILKYIRNTKDMFLVYGGDIKRELRVFCYTNAGYPTDADDLKYQTGYVFVLNGGDVDWESTKQSIFATSFAEVEYIAAYDTSKEAVWIRKFISELSVVPTIKEFIMMYCDNTGAITIANESAITKGARHYCAKVYYLREVIELGDVKIEKVHTYDNLADPFTNTLPLAKHSEHTHNIGILSASSLMSMSPDTILWVSKAVTISRRVGRAETKVAILGMI
ncbi:hypothetical protein Tco_1578146 [Tanacetum coccineum]